VSVSAHVSIVRPESGRHSIAISFGVNGAAVAFEGDEGVAMRIWLCGLCVAVALPVSGGDRMTMTVTPAQAFAPSLLRVRIRIEPSAENRSLTVSADSGGFYRSSEIQLDGERAPKTIELEFRSVPEGSYDILGIVKDRSGRQRFAARCSANLLGLGGD
jgi:hypothetical protein